MPMFKRKNKDKKKPSPSGSTRSKSKSKGSVGSGSALAMALPTTNNSSNDATLERADSLGDLAEAFGDDYGHGFAADAFDPNVKPTVGELHFLASTTESLSVSLTPVGQGVTRVVAQLMPGKKKTVTTAFKKGFDSSSKGGGKSRTFKGNEATAVDKVVFMELDKDCDYFCRLVATNAGGVTEGPVCGPFKTKANAPVRRIASKASQQKAGGPGKLFAAPSGPQRSKIWQALNPDKLYFESRREKVESDKVVISIRGGGESYAKMRDDEGNIIEESESEYEDEEEDYDPNNLPDFGPFQEEMNKLRAERAKALEERQAKLREAYQKKKDAEQAELDAELARIKAIEDARKAKNNVTDKDVQEVQKRLEKEVQFDFKFES